MPEESGLKEVHVRLALKEGQTLYSSEPMNSPWRAVDVMREALREMDREMVCVVNLDTKLHPINYNIVSIGSIDQSVVPIQNVFKSSILSNAASIMVLHNHPSGDVTPSQEDYDATHRLSEAGKLMDIRLVDHIIVGGDRGDIYSFREHNEHLFTGAPDLPFVAKMNAGVMHEPVPVYQHSTEYARQAGQLDLYRASRKENIRCKEAIEDSIREHYDGRHLNSDCVKKVVDEFGPDRVFYVLANNIQFHDWDGRYSQQNKEWAKGILIPKDQTRYDDNRNIAFLLDSHPVLVNAFLDTARKQYGQEQKRESVLGKLSRRSASPSHPPAKPTPSKER